MKEASKRERPHELGSRRCNHGKDTMPVTSGVQSANFIKPARSSKSKAQSSRETSNSKLQQSDLERAKAGRTHSEAPWATPPKTRQRSKANTRRRVLKFGS